jgi:Pyruvate/2-oxoglutarate dehydrogenase complex, dehydrogenase (E1) component, eukaryotic type, alpha subunit
MNHDAVAESELYRLMVLTRKVEEAIEISHRKGMIDGSFHSSLGQEAVAAGVCAALRPSDIVTSTHRGHGHALSKGVSPAAVMAELFKRTTGTSGGRGGSMHLHDRQTGFYGETAIVGGGLPWAAGAAWARRRSGSDDIAVAFAGDGAFAHGVFSESLRMAAHRDSPVLFVCENNGWAHSMPVERVFGPPGSISKVVGAMGIEAVTVDGRDAAEVHRVARDLIAKARTGRPMFLECVVYRVRPHSLTDADYRYRPKGAGDDWLHENDPLQISRRRIGAELADAIDAETDRIVEEAIAFSVASPVPAGTAAFDHIYTSEELTAHAAVEIR